MSGGSEKIQGVDLYYEEKGDGVPVLLIHPAGADASTWASAADGLALVISYDRPGYSRSGGEPVARQRDGTTASPAAWDHLSGSSASAA